MTITHKLDAFFLALFPGLTGNSEEEIIQAVKAFYTIGDDVPVVEIEGEWLHVHFEGKKPGKSESTFQKAIALCEKRQFAEALPLVTSLLSTNPQDSELHRILGQIHSEMGDQDEAINALIDALRWNPKNSYALLMMGNIFARFKDDVETAMTYYDQALLVNPKDHISMNNIGANLMRQGKISEAKRYFEAALSANGTYPNTHYALSMVAEAEGDFAAAFESAIKAIRGTRVNDPFLPVAVRQANEVARKVLASDVGQRLWRKYQQKLEYEGEKRIKMVEDSSLPTAAKIEFAENHQRDEHIIRYKTEHPAIAHLVMHELVHLDFVLQARKTANNQLFVSNQEHRRKFIGQLEPSLKRLRQKGLGEDVISKYANDLFDGMNRQVFNAPIDLFIEDYLHEEFPELRPIQFISMHALLMESIKAVTDSFVLEVSPKDLITKSKVYNMVGAKQFADLFGVNVEDAFKATGQEKRTAESLWEEFLEYRKDRQPGEEYELVQHWAEDLHLSGNFELVSEESYFARRDGLHKFLQDIEQNPFQPIDDPETVKRETEAFKKSQDREEVNMAVVMFMIEALNYFKNLSAQTIKQIAFEIAMQGTQGYRPDQKNYRLNLIPDKRFSGYHILAYYYVSWMLSAPEMVPQLGLPYDKEWEMAQQMAKLG
jgi:Flp pilus assembly protein TadD